MRSPVCLYACVKCVLFFFFTDIKAREKKVSFDESVEVRTIEAAPQEVHINPEQMESCLELLQNADPTEERPDSQEMLVLEGKVKGHESVEVKTIEVAPQEVHIKPEQIESCLELLQLKQ